MNTNAQRKPKALVNPYLDEFNAIKDRLEALPYDEDASYTIRAIRYDMYQNSWTGKTRHDFTHKYAWAIPNDEAIHTIASLGPIVEMGAGTGYWAHLLVQAGADVIAFDKTPPERESSANCYHADVSAWHPVDQGTCQLLDDHADRVLLLCWPPYATDMAMKCLDFYTGNTLVYVGESDGCTAGTGFEKRLKREWMEIATIDIPQWDGLHDYVRIFERIK